MTDSSKKKTRKVDVPMDDELYGKLSGYAKDNNVGMAALIRAVIGRWLGGYPDDPRSLPPNIQEENKRPSRKKK